MKSAAEEEMVATETLGLTIQDAKKLLRAAQIEVVKTKVIEIGKSWILYSDFVRVCNDSSSDPTQGPWIAKMLDDSGNVIVLGNSVCLRPDQEGLQFEVVTKRNTFYEDSNSEIHMGDLGGKASAKAKDGEIWTFTVRETVLKVPLSFFESLVWTCRTYYVIGYTPEASRFFRQFIMFFVVHLTSISMFWCIAAACHLSDRSCFNGGW